MGEEEMKTNQDRAEEIIREALLTAPRNRGMDDTVSPHIAKALADAGLLSTPMMRAEFIIQARESFEQPFQNLVAYGTLLEARLHQDKITWETTRIVSRYVTEEVPIDPH